MGRKIDANLTSFLDTMDEELGILDRGVAAHDGRGPLDRSYASLDRVEDYLGAALDSVRDSERDRLVRRVERYVGVTLVEHTGAAWIVHVSPTGRPDPRVTKLPELKRYQFSPGLVVNIFTRTRLLGVLRDETELYDVPHRRATISRMLAEEAHELERFAEGVGALTGHDTTLDGSVDSLDLVQEALANMWESGPSREYQRVVQARAVLYVGNVFRQSLGRGQWELCTDPARVEFGHLTIDDWAPITSVRVIRRTSRPALLREAVVRESEARKR